MKINFNTINALSLKGPRGRTLEALSELYLLKVKTKELGRT